MTGKLISDGHANCFLLIAVAVLMLNIVSQVAAFPLQVILIVYAVVRSDIKLFPGLFVALLDKSCFPSLGASILKFRLGISIGVENVFVISVFLFVVARMIKNHYSISSTGAIVFAWLISLIPALVMSRQAKADGLAMWQEPIVSFLTPSLYFWGWSVGRTWDRAKGYFIKRMSLVFLALNLLAVGGHFYRFSFVYAPLSVGLAAASFIGRPSRSGRLVALACFAAGICNALFRRYVNIKDTTGYADAAELGSTFTVVMTVLFAFAIIGLVCVLMKAGRGVRYLPLLFLVPLVVVFFYASGRAGGEVVTNDVGRDYKNIVERFEFKLIGDRGAVWADGLNDVMTPPHFFKRYRDRVVMGRDMYGQSVVTLKMLPHNQILTLLVTQGWWLGLFCIIFLFWTHFRMFRCAAFMQDDQALICSLLTPSAAVFYAVGLTGQSVWSSAFTGNGLVTLVFPGIVYGAWLCRVKATRTLQF